MAKLAGGVGVIKVGAATETEMKEKKFKIEDALNATKAAVAEGIVPGGGAALVKVANALNELLKENKIELTEDEMEKLSTSIILRNPKVKNREIIGDIFLIKFFNKLEDARELSAVINACSRLGKSHVALQLCMEVPKAKKTAEEIYIKYKQLIISGLKFTSESEKIHGKNFIIINAKDKIKDTMIGTIASILSYSSIYEEGTAIVAMAYCKNKIKGVWG